MTSLAHSGTPLEALGLEEVEPWVVEDSYENRRALRANKFYWSPLEGEDGLPTGLIRAFDPAAIAARRESVWDRRRPLLVDENNAWSDYIPATEYPVDADVPQWVRSRTRHWVEQKMEGVPEEKRVALPTRCRVVRTDGTRCWNWVSRKGMEKCKQHLGWSTDADVARTQIARTRILQASVRAVEVLEELSDSAEGEAVRLKASTEILDRAGVRGGVEIDIDAKVEHVDPSQTVRERLDGLAKRLASARAKETEREDRELAELEARTVDAVVIEDPQEEAETHDAQ